MLEIQYGILTGLGQLSTLLTRLGEGPIDILIREKPIVEEFKRRVERQFPGELIRLVVFGSRVRGEATAESDLDILVVIRSDDWRRGDRIRALGHALEIEHGVVLSIQVISLGHYEKLRVCGAQFLQAVMRAIPCQSRGKAY